MANLLKLPIGDSSFDRIRRNGFLYVDKTEWVYRLVDSGMFYFLSRPRRFGKSLLVSTLQCLFEARRELFDGLWLGQQANWDWQPHPVVIIDFNEIRHNTPDALEAGLSRCLQSIAATNQLTLPARFPQDQFQELIIQLYQKTQRPVVVLVDEYDKPLISHLGQGEAGLEIAKANRAILKGFFGVLKGASVMPCLRFVFLTGISRFSKVSIFSELNNLDDISMSDEYAGLLGYTQNELETYFQPRLADFAASLSMTIPQALTALAAQYNGYRFAKQTITVYNPFSVLNAFRKRELGNYWFESATPTFLVNLLQEQRYSPLKIEDIKVSHSVFNAFDIEQLQPEALLFQTGYLTIRDCQNELYTLAYPNQEVKTSLSESLLTAATATMDNEQRSLFKLLNTHLRAQNWPAFFDTIHAIFAAIPYTLSAPQDEAYFHTLFYLMLTASGAYVRCEVLTSRGRIDLAVEYPDVVYVLELKCRQSPARAIRQIRDNGYAEPYRAGGKPVFLIGINFSLKKRNVGSWKVEPF